MRGLAFLILCFGLTLQAASAAEMDGRWVGAVPIGGGCDFASTVTLLVEGGAVHGLVQKPDSRVSIRGDVDGEGSGSIRVDNNTHGTLRFVDGHFVIDWKNNLCPRHADLQRDTAVVPGRFDGAWQAERLAMGKPCNASTYLRMVVVGGEAMGELYAPWHDAFFTASIGADGGGRLEMEGAHGAIRIQGDRFQISWVGGRCGSEVALGDRMADAAKQAQMQRTRLAAQQVYKDLMAAAETATNKVNYTALRAASIHNDDWAFYNNKADTVMSQAAVEAKGGDCTEALPNLDLAIRYDFTMDTAHALKADCLRKADPRRARIEDTIANGLVRSLMTSGNGKSEKTAYVVTTGREMNDVLANRHIDVRTRSNETRGSDGHFYAAVQGLAVNGKAKKLQTIYFNVDAFVAGRQSKRAPDKLSSPP